MHSCYRSPTDITLLLRMSRCLSFTWRTTAMASFLVLAVAMYTQWVQARRIPCSVEYDPCFWANTSKTSWKERSFWADMAPCVNKQTHKRMGDKTSHLFFISKKHHPSVKEWRHNEPLCIDWMLCSRSVISYECEQREYCLQNLTHKIIKKRESLSVGHLKNTPHALLTSSRLMLHNSSMKP